MSVPPVMQAVQFARFGPPEELRRAAIPTPTPAAGQVLVRVVSAGLNPIDWKTRKGLGFVAEQIAQALPWTPGFEIAGVVEQIAPDVTAIAPGDTVFGFSGFPVRGGGYAQFALAEAAHLAHLPESVNLETAGAIPLAALTAWQALFEVGHLRKGQIALIHAAAGGVGHFAVQFAKAAGADVIATASEKNRDFLKSLGVDEVIDYRTQKFAEECENLDLVLDGVGGQTGIDSLKVLRPGGTVVTLPTLTAAQVAAAAEGTGKHVKGMTMRPDAAALAQIAQLAAGGKLRVEIQQSYSLADAPAAHHLLETGSVRGKLLLSMVPS
ncbi:NADP-dependent oxidoreductase [Oscillatoria laete-virens NRMC-F 0139]|nr:NADP-dependent oxidoreductase [Oscillatoria laete-virens]MDL5052980.1 NADP-dependent oxidoreductase [Oscillatoria laete-virens NRMC-F 0139]